MSILPLSNRCYMRQALRSHWSTWARLRLKEGCIPSNRTAALWFRMRSLRRFLLQPRSALMVRSEGWTHPAHFSGHCWFSRPQARRRLPAKAGSDRKRKLLLSRRFLTYSFSFRFLILLVAPKVSFPRLLKFPSFLSSPS